MRGGNPGECTGFLRAEIGGEANRFGQMAGGGIDDPLRIAGVGFLDVLQVDVLGSFGGKRGDDDGTEGREKHRRAREPGQRDERDAAGRCTSAQSGASGLRSKATSTAIKGSARPPNP